MAQKTKPHYHHGDLKAAMVRAALELVRTKGPRGFSLNEASRRAGVSVSAPYNHFKDKDALLIEIVLLGNRTLKAEIRLAAENCKTDKEKLLAVYKAYIAFAKKHPDLFSVMFQSGVDKEAYPEVRTTAEEAFAVGVEIAARLEGSRDLGIELALAVWAMAHGLAMLSAEDAFGKVTDSGTKVSTLRLAQRLLA